MCNSPMFFLEVKKICLSLQSILRNMFQEMAEVLSRKCRKLCGNSSVGRAQPCQGWGREFESRFPLQAGQHIAGLLFFLQRTRTRAPLPEGAAGQGRLRGLRKKSRHARVRGLESRFPLQAGQHIAGLLFFTEDSNSRPAPRGSCRPGRLRHQRKNLL